MEGEAAPVIDRSAWWTVHRGASPVLATAIHDGHLVRPELEARLALTAAERLREEDPFTGSLIRDFPNRIACHRSRFEVDLNRSRDEAVYLEPGQAWGLVVWNDPPPADMLARSLRLHDRYYAELRALLRGLEEEHGRLVVLDVHSYNHRRDGPEAPPTDAAAMPDINIGTFSMDRRKWSHVGGLPPEKWSSLK
jgi:N-formylglutamate amidohydrolase